MPTLTIAKKDYKVTKGNIVKMYNKATKQEFLNGLDWYPDTHNMARDLESDTHYQISTESIVGVIAALSPNNDWEKNKKDAISVLNHTLKGNYDLDDIKVSTYDSNKDKAKKIINGSDIETTLKPNKNSGMKTLNFFKCIMGDTNAVCVDGHAFHIASNRVNPLDKVPSLSEKNYNIIANEYKLATKLINKKYNLNLIPSQVQAITWVTYKRINNK